uniref:ARAD1B07392p n=1 Tax=Blastobotrys adeninivorans TaxID=409370 RepID=A0A060T616_BLAAD
MRLPLDSMSLWESTQDNLETAVGSAYSGWTQFNSRHVEPTTHKLWRWVSSSACCGCMGPQRRNSADIFFDMYEDDDVYAHDELDRLIDGEADDDSEEEFPQYSQTRIEFPSTEVRTTLRAQSDAVTNGLKSVWYWMFPWRQRYDPGTADMTNVEANSRSRSSTKSSTVSSDTLRSRADLFSDGDVEDAHLMSNYEVEMANRREKGRARVRSRTREGSSAREGSVREGCIREGSAREGSIREGSIREGSTREGGTREESIRESTREESDSENEGGSGQAPSTQTRDTIANNENRTRDSISNESD